MISSSRVAMVARIRPHFVAAVVLVLAGCGTTGGGDRPDLGATIVLDGPRAGVDAGMASAIARGYDEAEGVHLHLRGGPATPRTLTSGAARFAVLDLNELAGHPELVGVMALVQEPLLAFTTARHQLDAAWARRLAHVLGRPIRRWDLAAPQRATHIDAAGVPRYPELVLAVARQ